jgi:hypothetical protein
MAAIFVHFVAKFFYWDILTILKSWKFQAPKAKYQMVRQAHHPEPGRRANLNDQNSKFKTSKTGIKQ